MTKETGGPAFPLHPDVNTVKDTAWLGMTLRDYFAAKAMQSIMESYKATPKDSVAELAYKYADEMLKAREQ